PVRRPFPATAAGTAGRRISAADAGDRRLPGDVAGGTGSRLHRRHTGTDGQGPQAVAARAVAGRARARRGWHPFAAVPSGALPWLPPRGPDGQAVAARGGRVSGLTGDPVPREPPPPEPPPPEPPLRGPLLREPDLPRTAKVRQQALRTGWTTGTCAAAAAKAAVTALRDHAEQETVEVALPGGRRVRFDVHSGTRTARQASAVVVKDAGDDPDVTHGAHLTATVRW